MAQRDIVVAGASSGGVEALSTLARSLPPEFPAAFFVVLHTVPWDESKLAEILHRAGPLPAANAEHNKPFKPGKIYVAVPNHHLLIENGRTLLVQGPKENRTRPALDPLFRSAALAYGPRVIGIVLTGSLDDGTLGLWQIKRQGGIAVVQEPKDALFPGMPSSALENVEVDHRAPISEMGALLTRLVQTPVEQSKKYPPSEAMEIEDRIVKMQGRLGEIKNVGRPSPYVCPDCQGTLFEVRDGPILRYRCRTGHGFGSASLLADEVKGAEEALWSAMRALEEKTDILRQQAARLPKKGPQRAQLEKLAEKACKQAEQVKKLIRDNEGEAKEAA